MSKWVTGFLLGPGEEEEARVRESVRKANWSDSGGLQVCSGAQTESGRYFPDWKKEGSETWARIRASALSLSVAETHFPAKLRRSLPPERRRRASLKPRRGRWDDVGRVGELPDGCAQIKTHRSTFFLPAAQFCSLLAVGHRHISHDESERAFYRRAAAKAIVSSSWLPLLPSSSPRNGIRHA